LGVMAVDTKNDGKPDIMVANDLDNSFFYLNQSRQGEIALKEMGVQLGVATDGTGFATGSMGIAQADYDRVGAPSFYITAFEDQVGCLHHNRGPNMGGQPMFDYASEKAGLSTLSHHYYV